MTKRVLVTYPNGTEAVAEVIFREEYTWVRGHGDMQQLIKQQQCTVVPLVALTDNIRADIWSLVTTNYEHRNGETDSPKIDGYYWVLDGEHQHSEILSLERTSWFWGAEVTWLKSGARFWGPIPKPTQEQTP